MTTTQTPQLPQAFADTVERFIHAQEGRGRSPQAPRAYRSDQTRLAESLFATGPKCCGQGRSYMTWYDDNAIG